jgi:hypothetical protein
MKIYRPGFSLIYIFLCASIGAQTVTLSGSGLGYQNAELRFYLQSDPVTKRLKHVQSVTCNEKGSFSCEIPCPGSGIIFIKAGIYNLHLYITDSSRYELLFPDYVAKPGGEEQNPFFIETEFIPEVINNPEDVNNLIRIFDSDYNQVFNLVAERVFSNYNKEKIPQDISTLDKYRGLTGQPFYNDYVKCRMIMLKLISSVATGEQAEALEFINSGFIAENQALQDLAEQIFKGYFNKISSGPLKDSFNRAIAIASFAELRSVILQDGKITNKELADFVILLNLNIDYYEANLPGENVRKIISEMKQEGSTDFIKNVASAVLFPINSSLSGNFPPDFSLLNSDGKLMSLKNFRGKYLLLGFARSDNQASLLELGIINMWQKKYINDIQIVTILSDKDFKNACAVLKNKGFKWTFLDGSKKEMLEFNYNLKMYPSFLLLDREGKMIANPCLYPSENLEFTINKILRTGSTLSGSENR